VRRRIDWVAVDRRIRGFLAEEVTVLEVRRWARYMVTTPKGIAENTGLSVKTVRAHLPRVVERRVDGRVVMVRVDNTDVIVKLAASS
jgi:hypothetical protein